MTASHTEKVAKLCAQLQTMDHTKPLALQYTSGNSNTTRSKSYKNGCSKLDFSMLNEVVTVDAAQRLAKVEPRVSMEALVKATLPHGLAPPVVPEFKGITVGGAIMGGAAESASFQWGCFNDTCTAYEILSGDGKVVHTSPENNAALFYGTAGSYGSLGSLVSADIRLVPVKECVHLRYHILTPHQAIEQLRHMITTRPDFIDGIIFSEEVSVIIEGTMTSRSEQPGLPLFSIQPASAEWYFQHVKAIAKRGSSTYEELMPIEDYYFRYDRGAFWMGAYLFNPLFSWRLTSEALLKVKKNKHNGFSPEDVCKLHNLPYPRRYSRALFHPLLDSQTLWGLLHKVDDWVQQRIVIQDFCIPERHADQFLSEILENPAIFPLWLCPIKATTTPQIFAPHLLPKGGAEESLLINFGIYGIPSHPAPIAAITKMLERKTHSYGGRKVLYSHSYYTPEEFWQIYSKEDYEALRKATHADAFWKGIEAKVLSD